MCSWLKKTLRSKATKGYLTYALYTSQRNSCVISLACVSSRASKGCQAVQSNCRKIVEFFFFCNTHSRHLIWSFIFKDTPALFLKCGSYLFWLNHHLQFSFSINWSVYCTEGIKFWWCIKYTCFYIFLKINLEPLHLKIFLTTTIRNQNISEFLRHIEAWVWVLNFELFIETSWIISVRGAAYDPELQYFWLKVGARISRVGSVGSILDGQGDATGETA